MLDKLCFFQGGSQVILIQSDKQHLGTPAVHSGRAMSFERDIHKFKS